MTRRQPASPNRIVAIGLLLVFGTWTVWTTSSWWPWRSGAEARIVIQGVVSNDLDQVVLAAQAFVEAGLALPPTVVVVHPADRCPIQGHAAGRAYPGRQMHRVVVCTTDPRVLIHELAHAWTFEHLGARDRTAFALMRELPTWDEPAHDWEDRAMEHAAEIITWAVLGLPPEEILVSPRDPESLQFAYGYLLGLAVRDTERAVRPGVTGAKVRLSADPCQAVARLGGGFAGRIVGFHPMPSGNAESRVCWVTAAGTVEPVAVIEVPAVD